MSTNIVNTDYEQGYKDGLSGGYANAQIEMAPRLEALEKVAAAARAFRDVEGYNDDEEYGQVFAALNELDALAGAQEVKE